MRLPFRPQASLNKLLFSGVFFAALILVVAGVVLSASGGENISNSERLNLRQSTAQQARASIATATLSEPRNN